MPAAILLHRCKSLKRLEVVLKLWETWGVFGRPQKYLHRAIGALLKVRGCKEVKIRVEYPLFIAGSSADLLAQMWSEWARTLEEHMSSKSNEESSGLVASSEYKLQHQIRQGFFPS